MKSYFGSYFTSPGSHPQESSVLVFDKKISIGYRNEDGSTNTLHWLISDLEVSFDFSTQSTKIRNIKERGSELLINGNDAAKFIKEMKEENKKPWFRKSGAREWARNLFLLTGIAGILVLLYLLIVPWLSAKLASRVSIKTEQQIGEAVYDAMGMPAIEDSAKSLLISEFFAAMDIPTDYPVRITVINDNIMNAFALPGGRIVVYSALLKQVQSYPELAALLSHEFTHVNNKHTTKSIFRRLGSKVFISLLFGRFGTVTSIVINNADNLKSLKYSRRLEKEADTGGLALLQERKIDPQGFVDLFEHMKEKVPASQGPEFLGSHPDLDKRIEYIKEMSKNSTVDENSLLKTIFEKLK